MILLFRRPLRQASLSFGSNGHGAFRLIQSKTPLSTSIAPANANTYSLFSETQIRPGTLLARPAITAPSPRLTKSAGSAQQMSVLIEPKSVK